MRSLGPLIVVVVFCACSDNGGSPVCDADHQLVDGTCVGVTRPEICPDTYCIAAASCVATHYVKEGASGDGSKGSPFGDLPVAAAKAKAGDCIALAEGSYSAAAVVGGVSVLGTGADHVTLKALSVAGGNGGGRIRGLAIDADGVGLIIQGASGLEVEQVRISAATGQGLDARQAPSLKLLNVEVVKVTSLGGTDASVDATPDAGVEASVPDAGAPDASQPDAMADDAGSPDATPDLSTPDAGGPDAGADATTADAGGSSSAAAYGIGILVAKASSATIERCLVQNAGTQGILIHGSWVAVKQSRVSKSGLYGVAIDCSGSCKGQPAVEVVGCTLDHNKGIGLLALGGKLVARDNDVGDTSYAAGFARNVQLQNGIELTLERNTVHHSKGQGVVIDKGTGTVTDNTVQDNEERGMVIQGSMKLALEDNVVDGNERSGITAIGSTEITIKGGRVASTKQRAVIVEAKSGMVGDGVQVLAKSKVAIRGARVEKNARVGVLIDDAVAEVAETTITDGVDAIVVQNAKITDQKIKAKNAAGIDINATEPTTPYINNPANLPSTLPLPIP